MRVVFFKVIVRPEFRFNALKSDYLGFNYLISYLNTYETDVETFIAFTLKGIIALKPDIVCLSSVSEMWNMTKNVIVDLRKEKFSGPIIIGGPHITVLPETIPEGVECAVIGHGEQTLLELVRVYRANRNPELKNIPGLAYKNKNELVITKPSFPKKIDDLPLNVFINPTAPFQISTVRGCPFHCFHCVEHQLQGKLNFFSPDKLLHLMKKRLELTGNNRFVFQDDTFLAPSGRLENLHGLMVKENLIGKYSIDVVSLNANLVKEHTIPLLKEIGVKALGFGVESMNPRIIKKIKRGVVTLKHIKKTIEWATKNDISIGGSQVYGFPGETKSEMVDSILRVKYYERNTRFRHWVCFICQPLPGSLYWDEAMKEGKVSINMDFSTLRIDGDYRFFDSEWYYGNEEFVSRKELIETLKKYKMLPTNYFVPLEKRPPTEYKKSGLRRIIKKIYDDLINAIGNRELPND